MLKKTVLVHDCNMNIRLHIVSDDKMQMSAILGRDFTSHKGVKFVFSNNSITLTKEKFDKSFDNKLMLIEVDNDNDKPELNINTNLGNSMVQRVKNSTIEQHFKPFLS